MRRVENADVPSRAEREFLSAAELGARLEVRTFRARGLDDEAIRREIVREYGEVIAEDAIGPMADSIMETVRRAMEEELHASPSWLSPPAGTCPGRNAYAILHSLN